MTGCFHWLFRRLATGWALAAALSFVLNGALATDHHLAEPDGGYHGAHVHFHLPAQVAAKVSGHRHSSFDHQHVAGDGESTADLAAAHHLDSAPAPYSGADSSSNSHFASCYVGVLLPCPYLQAEPIPLQVNLVGPPADLASGIEPEGPRKPPRPSALA
jgi:hypothetical protein